LTKLQPAIQQLSTAYFFGPLCILVLVQPCGLLYPTTGWVGPEGAKLNVRVRFSHA